MGLDFIRSAAGKPWRKGWANGADALKQATLFDLQMEEDVRLVTMNCEPDLRLEVGAVFVLELVDTRLLVLKDEHLVGVVPSAPTSVIEALQTHAKVACGTVTRLGTFGDTAELRLQ